MTVIAIVGIDGSGKTTQAKLLVEKFNKEGYVALYVRPIYALFDLFPLVIKDKILCMSFFSPRKSTTSDFEASSSKPSVSFSLLKKIFLKIIGYPYVLITCFYLHLIVGRNKIVVCDRYFIQFLIDIYGYKSIHLLKFIPQPDMVFYIRGSLELTFSRMTNSFDTSVKEQYYENVLCNFEKISHKYNFIDVDANASIDVISNIIYNTVSLKRLYMKRI